jgi:hemoglobin/transferrin/lactoferrin receptor protein
MGHLFVDRPLAGSSFFCVFDSGPHHRARRKMLLAASSIAISLCLAPTAFAQSRQNQGTSTQPQSPLLTPEETTVLQRITVTATRDQRSVLDVPQTVTVIDSETIARKVVRDVQDLVRYTPGVSVDRQTSLTNPFGQLNAFNIRGVGANRVQILVDGSRIQERSIDGSRDFVDPFNMQAVEIVRGPNSVLWGSDALGGVVAFRTRDPEDLLSQTDRPWAGEIKAAYDSFDGSFRKQLTAAAEAGDFQILASLGHLSSNEPDLNNARADGGIWGCTRPDYFRCDQLFPADTDAWNGLAKIVWTPTDDHEVKLTGEFFNRNTVVDQIWDSQAGTSYINTSYPRELDMERARVALEHKWAVGSAFIEEINWQVSYSPQARDMESFQTRTYPTRIEERLAVRNYGETFLEADLQLKSVFDTGPVSHTLIYGFDGDITDSSYDGFNRNFRSDTGVTTVLLNQGFNFPEVETRRADFFIQDEIKLFDDRLTLTPGLRYSTFSIDPTGDPDYVSLPGFEPEKINQDRLTKKLGLVYDVNDTYSVYASYGEGFKMPTSQQLFVSVNDIFSGNQVIPNPNLRPESVRSYEAGVRGQFANGYFSVGGFYADYTDFIRTLIAVNPSNPNIVTSDNVESVKLWGIEISGEYEFHKNWWASASVSYQHGNQQVSADAPETPFDGAVPLTAVLGISHFMPEWNLEAEVVGIFGAGVERRSDPNAFKPGGYAVFDTFLTWKPTSNFELNGGIQNIFDTRYFPNSLTGFALTPASPAVANTNPLELQVAPGRTFKLGTTVRF